MFKSQLLPIFQKLFFSLYRKNPIISSTLEITMISGPVAMIWDQTTRPSSMTLGCTSAEERYTRTHFMPAKNHSHPQTRDSYGWHVGYLTKRGRWEDLGSSKFSDKGEKKKEKQKRKEKKRLLRIILHDKHTLYVKRQTMHPLQMRSISWLLTDNGNNLSLLQKRMEPWCKENSSLNMFCIIFGKRKLKQV